MSVAPFTPGPVLGIETSCDETAAAVFDPTASHEDRVLADVIASQAELHAPHGGVVPELASRQHLRDVRPVVERALSDAGVGLGDLAGVAVTVGPGLVGALLVGVSFAKSLVLARGMPLVGVHHLEGHVRSAFLEADEPREPYVALVVSGGHTSLFRVERDGSRRRHLELARTRDDAAGEAFDKVGKLLGLPYPSGPVIDRLVADGSVEPVPFPRARIKADGGRRIDWRAFSFSGIKTSVRHHAEAARLRPLGPTEDPRERADLLAVLAGFQEAVVDMLVRPTLRVLQEERLSHLVVVGGVSANTALRGRLATACADAGVALLLPSPRWSTDNAAMIAAAGCLRLERGERADMDLQPDPAMRWEEAA